MPDPIIERVDKAFSKELSETFVLHYLDALRTVRREAEKGIRRQDAIILLLTAAFVLLNRNQVAEVSFMFVLSADGHHAAFSAPSPPGQPSSVSSVYAWDDVSDTLAARPFR